jgi:hypothetical protein
MDYKDALKKVVRIVASLRTPRVLAWFKLGAAIVTVIVAADEVLNGVTPKKK